MPGVRTPLNRLIFDEVVKRQGEILSLMKKGDEDAVREAVDDLIQYQQSFGNKQNLAKSLCQLANYAKEQGWHPYQLELVNRAVRTSPWDVRAHGQMADALFSLGRFEEALQYFDTVEAKGDRSFALTGRGRVFRKMARYDEALKHYEQAIIEYPDEINAWIGRAETLRNMRRLDEALDAYKELQRQHPDDNSVLNGLASTLNDRHMSLAALAVYEQILRLRPNDNVARCGHAETLRHVKGTEAALSAYHEIIEMDRDNVVAICGAADCLKNLGRLDEALEYYKDAVRRSPYLELPKNGRADILRIMGRHEEALKAYDDILEEFPDCLVTHVGRADAMLRMGRWREALEASQWNAQRFPSDYYAQFSLAHALRAMGRIEQAIEAYSKAYQRDQHKWSARVALAAMQAALDRWDEAMDNLPQRLEMIIRHDWIALLMKILAQDMDGETPETEKTLEEPICMIEDQPVRDYFRCALAIFAMREGLPHKALRRLQSMERPPALAGVLTAHAQCAAGDCDWENARRAIPESPPAPPFLDEYLKALERTARSGPRAIKEPDPRMFHLQRKMLLLTAV